MTKTVRARYTLEFKQEAVRLVTGGHSIASAARSLGVVEQTLFNWVKAERSGKLKGTDSKVVSAEQMEISPARGSPARAARERREGQVLLIAINMQDLTPASET